MRSLRLIGPGLVAFWALYFTIVALSNLTDLLRGVGILPAAWRWVSGNLAFIAASTAPAGAPAGLTRLLLAGVVIWQAWAAWLLWHAVAPAPADERLGPAFAASLGLWAVFVLLDEALLIFETGAEATHLRLFIAQLVSLLAIRALRPAAAAA